MALKRRRLTSSIPMSRFLDIPLELRELIIARVLYSSTDPPSTALELNGQEYYDLNYSAWVSSGTHVYYTQQDMPSSSKCLSLLLTNRQLSTETRAVLERRKLDYIVDISVKNELDLFLTWQSVPCLSTHISTLYTNVRLFGPIIDSRTIQGQLGDGGRRGFHWSFYAALERFLRYGPVGYRKDLQEFEGRNMLIDTLVMDFQSADLELTFPPDNVTFRHWSDRHNGSDRWRNSGEISKTLSSYKPRPEWLCNYLHGWIDSLLTMSYHVSLFGMPLYEHIGSIQMLVDGRRQFEIDLASKLADLSFTDPRSMMGHLQAGDRETGFWKWKRETLLRREAQGFPVISPARE
ncbi:hypothetical protein P175DRAFT_0531969 [Aspergillus ochraceoroseus IBT 24754]|uniref:F-box domain-containing protein n=2 Tax=Aspergillus ochraceoroseus TaxID=138278 RepID=A0A2T5LWG6_9EURO|nr:uncharacterized protein P175DRAFT_0531969 [Aspergillus ochraceoroseus IBT 24754]PTU20629.1 hypothetical protein P175DRAFT_0531969 [Aspergillus ochraceoroseus IBT 24754]